MTTANNSPSRRKSALITGASGGIGYELSKLFAQDGYNLVLVARSEQRLKEFGDQLAGQHRISVKALARDLAQPSAADEIFAVMVEQGIQVDALVNNAGLGLHGFFTETDLSRELQMIQVNITTLTHLTKLFLPGMVERKYGRILNIASTAAFQPGPLMAVYYASKAYVLHFSEAVANELKDTGVTVTALCPGPTQTGFQASAEVGGSRLFSRGLMSPETVARTGYWSLMKGQTVVIPGLRNQLLALAPRFAPRDLATQLVRWFNDRSEGSAH